MRFQSIASDSLIDFLLTKSDVWSEVSLDSDRRLFARHKIHNRLQVHLVESARAPLALASFDLPCALAISTNPDQDDRLASVRGPKRLEESRSDWLIYLLIDSQRAIDRSPGNS